MHSRALRGNRRGRACLRLGAGQGPRDNPRGIGHRRGGGARKAVAQLFHQDQIGGADPGGFPAAGGSAARAVLAGERLEQSPNSPLRPAIAKKGVHDPDRMESGAETGACAFRPPGAGLHPASEHRGRAPQPGIDLAAEVISFVAQQPPELPLVQLQEHIARLLHLVAAPRLARLAD